MKKISTIQKWVVIGVSEIILSLILIAIAPNFLNSDKPVFGFVIWLSVPTILGSSGIYVVWRIVDAQKAKSIFIDHFSDYNHLKIKDFLEIPSQQLIKNLPLLEATKNDSNFSSLELDLFELLEQVKNHEN